MSDFIPYGRHCIEEDDIAAVAAVLRSDHLTGGPVVEEFETAFAKRVGARHAVAVSSGTAGLPGRVDSPPSIRDGRAYFGSADGWVYCLRARDGHSRGGSAPRRRTAA